MRCWNWALLACKRVCTCCYIFLNTFCRVSYWISFICLVIDTFSSSDVWGLLSYTFAFSITQRKKTRGLRSEDDVGHILHDLCSLQRILRGRYHLAETRFLYFQAQSVGLHMVPKFIMVMLSINVCKKYILNNACFTYGTPYQFPFLILYRFL